MDIRMGQINSGFSWNTAPGTFNPYVTAPPRQIPNTYGGAPAYPAEDIGTGTTAPPQCFTCTNPSTGDTQYGVPAAQAADLKGKGYRCKKDECARPVTPGQIQQFGQDAVRLMNTAGDLFRGITAQGITSYTPPPEPSGLVMAGRIPLSPGLGRRALG